MFDIKELEYSHNISNLTASMNLTWQGEVKMIMNKIPHCMLLQFWELIMEEKEKSGQVNYSPQYIY